MEKQEKVREYRRCERRRKVCLGERKRASKRGELAKTVREQIKTYIYEQFKVKLITSYATKTYNNIL